MRHTNLQERASERRAGFTLIEVMIAAIIVSVAFLAAISMHFSTVQANISSRNLHTAVVLAQTELAALQRDAMAWDGSTFSMGTANPSFGPRLQKLQASYATATARTAAPFEAGWVNSHESDGLISSLGVPEGTDKGVFGSRLALFCVESRLIDETEGSGSAMMILRAEVAVYWAADAAGEGILADCSSTSLSGNRASPHLRRVTLSGAIPWYL